MSRKVDVALLLLVFGALFWALNHYTVSMADDLLYEYYYPQTPCPEVPHGVDHEHPITSFAEILPSQWNHYHYMNGRLPVHVLVQTFCCVTGKWAFDIFNTLSVLLMIYLLGLCCFEERSLRFRMRSFIPFALLLVLLVHPHVYYMGVAWGVNYTWTSVLCLALWYVLTHWERFTHSKMRYALPLVAFLAGWSIESIVIPLGFMLCFWAKDRLRKLTPWQYGLAIAFGLGAVLLVFAPGNFHRGREPHGWMFYVHFFSNIRIIYLVLLALCYGRFCQREKLRAWMSQPDNRMLCVGFFVSTLIMLVAIGPAAQRSGYGLELFGVILFCRLLCVLVPETRIRLCGAVTYGLLIAAFGVFVWCQRLASQKVEYIHRTLAESTEQHVTVRIPKPEYPKVVDYFITPYNSFHVDDWNDIVWEWYYGKEVDIIEE